MSAFPSFSTALRKEALASCTVVLVAVDSTLWEGTTRMGAVRGPPVMAAAQFAAQEQYKQKYPATYVAMVINLFRLDFSANKKTINILYVIAQERTIQSSLSRFETETMTFQKQ